MRKLLMVVATEALDALAAVSLTEGNTPNLPSIELQTAQPERFLVMIDQDVFDALCDDHRQGESLSETIVRVCQR